MSQQRTGLLLSELQHASERGADKEVQEGCKPLEDGYTRYRQAKKASCDFDFRPVSALNPSLHSTVRDFERQNISLKSLLTVRLLASRAPPIHD
jgi:hypothetical protein